jgi:hypothetical protein
MWFLRGPPANDFVTRLQPKKFIHPAFSSDYPAAAQLAVCLTFQRSQICYKHSNQPCLIQIAQLLRIPLGDITQD